MTDFQLGERVARLEVLINETRDDTKEIKQDVKALLENKWKMEGKRSAYTVVISAVVALVTSFLKGH